VRVYINHLGLTEVSENAFASIHAVLLDPNSTGSIIYLYRNSKGTSTRWAEDRDGGKYSSLPNNNLDEFNSDLDLDRSHFDDKYRKGGRNWNDSIKTGEDRYDTWATSSNFRTRREFMDAVRGGRGGLRIQNYFISFKTGDKDKDRPLANAPSFTFNTAGAKCILLRVSGSPNISADISGEYIIAFNGTETCDSNFHELRGIGILEWLFGYRN
jgi:hypothetical protein